MSGVELKSLARIYQIKELLQNIEKEQSIKALDVI